MIRDRERFSNVAPTQVLSDAINRLVAAPGASSIQVTHAFVPSQKFRGAKKGYYFGKGERGVGYYRDRAHKGSCAKSEEFPWYSGPITNLTDELRQDEGEEAVGIKASAVDAQELLRQAEEQARPDEIQLLDAKALKRLILAFERKLKENMELRMKYADQPEKFMDTEVDLDEQVKSMMQAAGSPELYPVIVESNCIPQLLSVLTHENVDIAADVIELFMELTDADAIEDSEEEAAALVDAMLEHNALELLVHRLTTLDESNEDQAKTAFNIMSVFENMNEVRQNVAEELVEKTNVLKWLLTRIRARDFDSNKQYAASLLAILMQGHDKNQRAITGMNGIDIVLQSIAPYKSKDPQTLEEEEFLEDCFNILCSSLMLPLNKTSFVKAEGVELMVLMLRQKRISRFGAIKTLDFATTRNAPSCERFVDHTGLKLLFAIFMGKAKVKGPKGEKDVESEVEERLVSIISNLLQNLPKGARRERVAAKFVENQMEKLDRLFEIYFRYDKKVADAEDRLSNLSAEFELTEDEILLERLGAGLYSVQQCCLLLGHLWATEDPGLRKRIVILLHQKGQTLENVRHHLRDLYRSIGDAGNPEEAARQKRRIGRVLLALGVDIEAEEAARQLPPEEEAPPLPVEEAPENGHLPPLPEPEDVEMEVEEEDVRAAPSPERPPPPADEEGHPPPPPVNGLGEEEEQGQLPERGSERGEAARSRPRDAEREKDRDREGDRERVKERDREREREREREKERDREREREKERGHKEKFRDRDREKERELERTREKERSQRDELKRREKRDYRAGDEDRSHDRHRHHGTDERKRRKRDKSLSRSP